MFTFRYWKPALLGLCLVGTVNLCSQKAAEPDFVLKQYRSYPVPEQMTFAGEAVPLNIPDVAERLDRELQSNAYFHSNTILGLKRMSRHLPEIEASLREQGLPDDIKYVALAESLLGNVVSPAGAAGVWQLMPDTSRGYGIIINDEIDERYHLAKATVAAAAYFKTAKAKFGSWTNAAASYNRGMSGLQRALAAQHVSSYYDLYLNDETSRYLFRILALKEVLSNPDKYGFDTSRIKGYAPIKSRTVTVTESIKDLPQFALDNGTNYKTLRLYNPWLKDYKLTVTTARPSYELLLPAL
ncbi:lytic transglycosylase domain-containing protein [Pontibacter qinzhouensis]|uniref:Lytic transglycosylase domain-containing protein n=1 Tax=Pontibacter qinzhouensis TaxID=2603253 RepID=A0A5C8JMP4_9BACT|nr:lytic transglycosylase domain-containing protein [Pontibacter qinzhouensis]TXK37874.1 lytic transglycosylase domain-containing protein [Pontibacter qinzhouensis]